jgi:hypothetical protein
MFFLCGLIAVLTIAVLWLTRVNSEGVARVCGSVNRATQGVGSGERSLWSGLPGFEGNAGNRSSRKATAVAVAPLSAVAASAQSAVVRVEAGERAVDCRANELGVFERVRVEPGETVPIAVAWPNAMPGERVVAVVEDGGQMEGGERVKVLVLDERRMGRFEFTTALEPGLYRVTLRRVGETKTVELWVGAELPLVKH